MFCSVLLLVIGQLFLVIRVGKGLCVHTSDSLISDAKMMNT